MPLTGLSVMNRSSTRLETPSLSKIRNGNPILDGVLTELQASSAISRFDNPWATPRTTSVSRFRKQEFRPLASTARMLCDEANASTRVEICSQLAQICPFEHLAQALTGVLLSNRFC